MRVREGRVNRAVVSGAALLALVALNGCMLGPDYQRPDVQFNEGWLDQPRTAAPTPINARWWEQFNDPTLTALIERGASQNLSLRQAGLRVLEARAARGITVGQFFPQMQEAFGGIDVSRISANNGPPPIDRTFATAQLGLAAAWELDFWGKFRRGIEASDAEVLQSVAEYDTVLVSLAAEIATAYILIRSLEERIELTKSNVSLQQETLQLTETRFRLGKVSELDVSTARSTLANTRAKLPELEQGLRQTILSLCVLLGRTPSQLTQELSPATGASRVVPSPPPDIALGVPADLLRRRPDVRAAERAAAAQSARIGQAVADLLPRISITGATGFVSSSFDGTPSTSLGSIFNAESFAGFVGLQVNWPILNYGRIEGNIRVQDARYEQAVAAFQDSVLRAAADVESGLVEFLRSRERTAYLGEAVDASRRSVDLSLVQYRAGAVDFIRVNDAQATLVEQQDTHVIARAAISLGAVRTYRALGGGWESRGGGEFIDAATADRMRQRTNWGDVMSPKWEKGRDLGFDRPVEDTPQSNPETKP